MAIIGSVQAKRLYWRRH